MRKLWHRLFGHGGRFKATGPTTIINRMTGIAYTSTTIGGKIVLRQFKDGVWTDVTDA